MVRTVFLRRLHVASSCSRSAAHEQVHGCDLLGSVLTNAGHTQGREGVPLCALRSGLRTLAPFGDPEVACLRWSSAQVPQNPTDDPMHEQQHVEDRQCLKEPDQE